MALVISRRTVERIRQLIDAQRDLDALSVNDPIAIMPFTDEGLKLYNDRMNREPARRERAILNGLEEEQLRQFHKLCTNGLYNGRGLQKAYVEIDQEPIAAIREKVMSEPNLLRYIKRALKKRRINPFNEATWPTA